MSFSHATRRGVNLIELMLATSLGLLLINAVLISWQWQQANYRLQLAELELHQQSIILIPLLQRTLRSAGYAGCSQHLPGLIGFTAGQLLPNGKRSAHDAIVIYHLASPSAELIRQDDQQLLFTSPVRFKPQQTLMLGNCAKAISFKADKLEAYAQYQRLALTHPWPPLTPHCQLGLWQGQLLYLSPVSAASADFELHLQNLEQIHQANVYLSGIEQWQLRYRLSNQSAWISAQSVTNWQQIAAVRFDILLVSSQRVTKAPASYYFNGKTYLNRDGHLRQALVVDINLRGKPQ